MKFDKELNRMKNLMTYGLQTESVKQYKSVEYQAMGADKKTYGIVREGAKFYIKVSNKTKNVLKEDFDYIGGFMNRKKYEYDSYANALKNFEMKMNSINEATSNKKVMIETWSPERKEMVIAEASDKMKKEIARQRQIMANATLIAENKGVYEANLSEDGCPNGSCEVDGDCAATQKRNIKREKHQTGKSTNQGGDPFTKKPKFKNVIGENETLAWNDDKDYMDKSHGTEIGKSDPYTEKADNEISESCDGDTIAVNNGENCTKSPKAGTSEVGSSAPYDEKAENQLSEGFEEDGNDMNQEDPNDKEPNGGEPMEEDEYTYDDDTEDMDNDTEEDSEDFDDYGDDDDDVEYEVETDLDDENDRLDNIEDLVSKIADKLGVGEFDDDSLYDDDEDEYGQEDDDDYGYDEDEYDGDNYDEDEYDQEDDYGYDDYEDEDYDDDDVKESYRHRGRVIREQELSDFGKHPAYQKEPMKYPNPNHKEMDGYYDINDDSVKSTSPYGEGPGSGAPFEIDDKEIKDAITKSINMLFNKKKH